MENNPQTCEKIQSSLFGLPNQERFLKIVAYSSVIATITITLLILFIEGNPQGKQGIMYIFGVVLLSFFIYQGSSFLDKIRRSNREKEDRIKEEQKRECNETIAGTEGKLRKILEKLFNEEEGGNPMHITDTMQESKPGKIYSYAKNKIQFQKIQSKLKSEMENDILSKDIGFDIIEQIHTSLSIYTEFLEKVTDNLIAFMPYDTESLFEFEDRELYSDIILEENSWVEHRAIDMKTLLDTWIDNHQEKVKQKRELLNNSLIQHENALKGLLDATNNLRNSSFSKIQVQL